MRQFPQTWRYWILGWMLFTHIGIHIIESTHHHLSASEELHCAICQSAAHHPLDINPTAPTPVALVLFLLFILPYRRTSFQITNPYYTSYLSRAPPSLSV